MRFLRDQSWSGNFLALAPGTTYFLSFSAPDSSWSIGTSNPGLIDDLFLRKVTINNISRDPSTQNIESTYNPSNDDPDTKKINVSVEWLERGSTASITVSTYLSDIFDN